MTLDLAELWNPNSRLILFPVRHHSPAAARLVPELIRQRRPGVVLIEGPSDFNPRLRELLLPHRLPIAIYSFLRTPEGVGRSAYYPFCEHSPEWQALLAGQKTEAVVRFIDLPWADLASEPEEPSNRYADAELARSRYIGMLCERLGVEDFHALWDTLFELDAGLSIETYLRRCHELCGHCRLLEGAGRSSDRRREAFMAAMIRQALEETPGNVLVVTGGFHSLALHARLKGPPAGASGLCGPVAGAPGLCEPEECVPGTLPEGFERGIALTPYSFERLDSLTGYNAGMPNPGFYQQVWQDRREGRSDTHRTLLAGVARKLRERNQAISAADLIAAETTARGLAALRSHPEVWRNDLVDGLVGSLLKEELSRDGRHPLLEAVHEVLRGGERGRLAAGASLPPVVADIQALLRQHELTPDPKPRDIELELEVESDRERSRVLHRLRLLSITGFERTEGTDLLARADLARIWEKWCLVWSPDFDAGCIEAARYGATLADAAASCLAEKAQAVERDAGKAASLLLDAALAGLVAQADALRDRVRVLVRSDADFFSVTGALGHLLYLYRYDAVLQTAGQGEVGSLLREAYERGLWLLETLGQVSGRDRELITGILALRETFERCRDLLSLDRDVLLGVLHRVGSDQGQSPLARGAVVGACWSLGGADPAQVLAILKLFLDPGHLGDFLTGLFALAREQVQRQHDLLLSIQEALARFSDDDFLTALPALRLAFTWFTPREKHHLALTLREALGLAAEPEMAALDVDETTAARALALEGKLLATLEKYGIRR
jgi:Family of unknown function (DUF5682)